MTITLDTANTLRGRAGTAGAVTYTLFSDEVTALVDSFEPVAQGQLGTGIATLYTVPAATQTIIKTIHLAETSGLNVTGISFYVNGSTAANKITGTITLPANGTAIYDGNWHIYDSAGVLQFTGTTGPSGTVAVGAVTNIGTAGPPTVTNVGTPSAAVLDFGLQQGATGATGAPGVVQTVTAGDTTLVAGGTPTDPTLRRAAITGDITIAAGSNASALASNVNLPGNPTTTTAAPGDNDTSIATTAFVTAANTALLTGTITNGDTTHAPTGDATFDALALKADLASPALTGNPTAPTPAPGDNDTSIATTAFATGAIGTAVGAAIIDSIADADTTHAPSRNAVFDALALKADLASPTFTGDPKAPTPAPGDSDTSIATTAFVTTADNLKANLASPTFTGNPLAPTPAPGDNDTSIATTAFVTAADQALLSATITNGDTTHAPNNDAVFDALALKADLASPAFTGNPTAPNQTLGDSDTSIANTAFVNAEIANDAPNVTLTTVGAAPNTNAASLTGQALNLQPSSAAFAGVESAKDYQRERREWDSYADFNIIPDLRTAYELPAAGTQQVIANGGTTVTIPNIAAGGTPFTSTAVDGGKRITITGGATGGAQYVGTIVSVTNSSTCEVTPAAGATVTANATGPIYVYVQWGTDNTTALNNMVAALNAQNYPTGKVNFGKYANPDWTNSVGWPVRTVFNKTVWFQGVGGSHTADVGDYTKLGGTRLAWWGTSMDGGSPFGAMIEVSPSGTASAVAFVRAANTNSGTASSTTATATLPSSPATGNMLITTVTWGGTGAITPPAGWTLLGTTHPGSNMSTAAYYRVAQAGDPASWMWTVSNVLWTVNITEYSGASTSLVPVVGFASAASTTTINSPVVVAPSTNNLIHQSACGLHSGLSTVLSWAPPASVTERSDGGTNAALVFNPGASHNQDTTNQAAAGNTTARTFTASGTFSEAHAYTIAIAPNAGSANAIKRPRFSDCWIDGRNGDQNQALYGAKLASGHGAMLDDFGVMDCAAAGLWLNIDADPTEAKDTTRFDFNRMWFRQLDNPVGTLAPPAATVVTAVTAAGLLTNVTPIILTLTSVTGYNATGGYALVTCTSGRRHVIKYSTVSGSTLTGCIIAPEEVIHTPTVYVNSMIIPCYPGNGGAIKMDGGTGANTSVGKVVSVQISLGEGFGQAGIDLGNTDTIDFDAVTINGGSQVVEANGNGDRRPGVQVNGSIVSNSLAARNNTFSNLDPGGSPTGPKGRFVSKGVTNAGTMMAFPSGPTYLDLMAMGNGSTPPLVELGAQLDWDGNGLWKEGGLNASSANQALTAAALNIVTGSTAVLPPQGWQMGTTLRWHVKLNRTGAGTTSTIVTIRQHSSLTAGGGTAIATATFTGTAVADEGWIEVDLVCTSIATPATATALARYRVGHNLAATGLFTGTVAPTTTPTPAVGSHFAGPMTMATFNSNAAAAGPTFIWLEINPNLAASVFTVLPPTTLTCVKAANP